MPDCQISQIALCSADVPRSMRVLSEAFGFAQSGSRGLWGENIGRVQGLPTAGDTTATVSWLVGRQDFVQIELFHHTNPPQRAVDPGRTPADLGWSRWGIATEQFEATLVRLAALGIRPESPPTDVSQRRSVLVREPGTRSLIEILERGPEVLEPAFAQHFPLTPALAFVAATVGDLEVARRAFGEALGLEELPHDALHGQRHHDLDGPGGSRREVALFRGGTVLLELTTFHEPTSRPRPDDALLSDQGMQNIAVGFRRADHLATAYDRLIALGATCPVGPPPRSGGIYVTFPDGLSLELLVAPRDQDAHFGFAPLPVLGRSSAWPGELPA